MKTKRRIKTWWHFTKLIWRGDPVRTWHKLEDGRYMCDGDCGRWTLHGVCTCGLSHFFKPGFAEGGRKKVARDNVSWHREYQTERIMQDIEYENKCPHDLSWNDHCDQCHEAVEQAIKDLIEIERLNQS